MTGQPKPMGRGLSIADDEHPEQSPTLAGTANEAGLLRQYAHSLLSVKAPTKQVVQSVQGRHALRVVRRYLNGFQEDMARNFR